MRMRTWIAVLTGLLSVLGSFTQTTTQAELNGNYYRNAEYYISFGRPNEAWKFLEIPAPKSELAVPCRALAAFSNGDGQAIAMLAHCAVHPISTIGNAGDLSNRWPSLVREIISLVSTGETNPSVEDSTYEVTTEAVRFELHYQSTTPGDIEVLENWVTGFLVCDTSNQQHIYAIRCAAPQAAAKAWESDFTRIMPTLRYDGPQRLTVFVPKSHIGTWLFILALGFAAGIMFLILRSYSRKAGARASSRALMNMAAADRAQANFENVPDRLTSTPDSPYGDGPERVGWQPEPPSRPDYSVITPGSRSTQPYPAPDHMNIPDAMNVPDAMNMPDSMSVPAPDVAVQTKVADGFWKCSCGRINPASYEFCARCNLDRPKKPASS